MKQSSILQRVTVGLRTEVFDPTNPEHVNAFVMITQEGRQHPTLRFTLEHPFLNVRSMMSDKVGREYVKTFSKGRSKTKNAMHTAVCA